MKHVLTLFWIAIFLTFFSCKKNQEPSASRNEISVGTSDKPTEITFTTMEYDFGTIKDQKVVNHTFEFKNTGKNDLLITNAQGSCGCTVPEYPKEPIKPGESGAIKVSFNPTGKKGVQQKTVTIFANTNDGAEILTIKAIIESKE